MSRRGSESMEDPGKGPRLTSDQQAGDFFEKLWRKGDPWEFDTAAFEQEKYARQFQIIEAHRLGRVLEIGCGNGCFTQLLARTAEQVVALDISPSAIEQARSRLQGSESVRFRVENILRYDLHAEGPWDLIVLSETIYYLGWLYTFFEVSWLVQCLFESTNPGGRALMTNTCRGLNDHLLQPWHVRTYHDLFVNVGYALEHEEDFTGMKNGAELGSVISLFRKPAGEYAAT